MRRHIFSLALFSLSVQAAQCMHMHQQQFDFLGPFPKDIWNYIASDLQGNNTILNFLSRTMILNDAIYLKIVNALLFKIEYFPDKQEIPALVQKYFKTTAKQRLSPQDLQKQISKAFMTYYATRFSYQHLIRSLRVNDLKTALAGHSDNKALQHFLAGNLPNKQKIDSFIKKACENKQDDAVEKLNCIMDRFIVLVTRCDAYCMLLIRNNYIVQNFLLKLLPNIYLAHYESLKPAILNGMHWLIFIWLVQHYFGGNSRSQQAGLLILTIISIALIKEKCTILQMKKLHAMHNDLRSTVQTLQALKKCFNESSKKEPS